MAYALVNAVAVSDYRLSMRAGTGHAHVSDGREWGAAPQAGVLIRDAEALEVLEKITTQVVVDKTGTLRLRANHNWSPSSQ